MFRIHKVFDVTTPANRLLLIQVQPMLRAQFTAISEQDVALGLPTLVVQAGSCRTQTLGSNARHFFTGLWDGLSEGRPATVH
jgi:hypothetical protein